MSNAAAAVALADAVAEVPAHDHVDEAAADLEVDSDNGRNDGGEDGRDTFGHGVADADEPCAVAVPVVANPAGHGGEPGPVALPMPPPPNPPPPANGGRRRRAVLPIMDLDALKQQRADLKRQLRDCAKTVKAQASRVRCKSLSYDITPCAGFFVSVREEQKRSRLLKKAGDLSDGDLLWLLRRQQGPGNP